MRQSICLLLCGTLLFFACKDSSKPANAVNEQAASGAAQNEVRGKHSYRRYTGSIAGQPVVVNLTVQLRKTDEAKDGYIVFGSYYYVGKSQVIELTLNGEMVRGDSIKLSESLVANAEEKIGAIWNVQITENGLLGKWTSEDKTKTYDLDLKEQYEEGAYPFDILDVDDSATVPGKEDQYRMQTSYSLLIPTANWKQEDAQFVELELLKALNKDTAVGGRTVAEFIKLKNRQLFDDYTKTVTENVKEYGGSPANNHDFSIVSTCEYNGRGMVVLALATSAYTGGAHGGYMTQYICMDIRDKKIWQLADMIKVDSAALGKILDEKLRISYDIKPGEKLSNTFLYDTIPPAENIALSDVGITMNYNQYEIGPYVMGPVSVFISFKELKDYLRPGFKQRWGI